MSRAETVARLVAASDALSLLLAVDGDDLTPVDFRILTEARNVLEELATGPWRPRRVIRS